MRYFRALVVFIVLLSVSRRASAQVPSKLSSMGRDFYIAYVAPSIKCEAIRPFQSTFVLISSAYDCQVTMSYFDATSGTEIVGSTYMIQQKTWRAANLDLSFMDPKDGNGNGINPNGEIPMYAACHIHSDHPIAVHYYSTGPNSGGMYLALPTQVLGKDYVVGAMPANPADGAADSHHFPCVVDSASSEFAVIAIANNTTVTITPNGLSRHRKVGVSSGAGASGTTHPFDVVLNRGQVFWVKSTLNDRGNDMSGSTVSATKPVAVIAAEEDAFNGTASTTSVNGGDQRNMIGQQMVPVKYLRSDGYLTMPFMDSPGAPVGDASAGDQFRIYSPSGSTETIDASIDQNGTITLQSAPYQLPPATLENIQNGMNIRERNGQPIMVEQYDYRAQNTSDPYPAPAMMNVVPFRNYSKTFMIGIPSDKNQVHQHRYFNVIARTDQFSKITVQKNGGKPNLLASYQAAGITASIPGHPELQGRRYEVQPGGYFIKGDSAFMVYAYGMLGIDPDFDLGDNDDDDYYFEYASPAGQTFGIDGGRSPAVSCDTNCSGWHLRVTDTYPPDGGIAQLEILKDAFGIFLRRPGTDSGYVGTNCSFSPPDFTVVPGDTLVDFYIIVNNPLQDADAWVWAVNVSGNDTLIHLHYATPKLSLLPDSAAFFNSKIGIDTCTYFTFKNLGKPGDQGFNVTGYQWLQGGQGVRMASITPTLPSKLKPGDSIVFPVCFNATQPAHIYIDTLVIETDCPTPIAPIVGTTTVPEIQTQDHDFGTVVVGQKVSHDIRVWNSGKAPFILTNRWYLSNMTDFTFTDTAKLPVIVAPGEGVLLNFCFEPMSLFDDTVIMHWSSDIPAPFTHVKKDFSRLSGRSILPDAVHVPKEESDQIAIIPSLSASDPLTIVLPSPVCHDCHVQIFDVLGRTVHDFRARGERIPIEVSGLANGTYIIRISEGEINSGIVRSVMTEIRH